MVTSLARCGRPEPECLRFPGTKIAGNHRKATRKIGGGCQAIGQIAREEMVGCENVVDPSQAVEGQMCQAAPDRIAHGQRTDENRGGRHHSQGHRSMGPPVIGQAVGDQTPGGHRPAVQDGGHGQFVLRDVGWHDRGDMTGPTAAFCRQRYRKIDSGCSQGGRRQTKAFAVARLRAYPKTVWEKGTVPFCSEDYAKSGQSPEAFRIGSYWPTSIPPSTTIT